MKYSDEVKARLLSRCVEAEGPLETKCLVFMGYCDDGGYGNLTINGRMIYTHRLAWELFRGPIPEGLCVLHKCDVANCVKPEHLWIGTRGENNADRDAKGRHVAPRGEMYALVLTERQASEVKFLALEEVLPQGEIASAYGITQSLVAEIKHGKRWADVEPIEPEPVMPTGKPMRRL